ncbi:MAG: hypothetical protein IPH78_11645 [Bacteroidetes bacterium]|nr:hypothetical protein [Bacteroidota bacterium]
MSTPAKAAAIQQVLETINGESKAFVASSGSVSLLTGTLTRAQDAETWLHSTVWSADSRFAYPDWKTLKMRCLKIGKATAQLEVKNSVIRHGN